MSDDQQTRDRVRALVRDVLASATTIETDVAGDTIADKPAAPPAPKIINVTLTPEPDFTRDESEKTIITEADLRDLESGARLRVNQTARFTPSADDLIRERNIEVVRRTSRSAASPQSVTVAVGADHGGFEMKRELIRFLAELGYKTRDFGTHSIDAVDYPDIAHAVARAVADKQAELGIIIDGAGVGSAMTANKVPGIRAAACYSVDVAKNSREHNDANVLTLGSKTITIDEMRGIVRAWLTTSITEDRHRKRVAKIEAIERQYQH